MANIYDKVYIFKRKTESIELNAVASSLFAVDLWKIDYVQVLVERMNEPYNATGPVGPLTWGTLLEDCRDLTRRGAELVWADPSWLGERSVDMPLWEREEAEGSSHAMELDCTQAISSGLTFRPLGDTIVDTQEWAPGWDEMKVGPKHDEEKPLLEEYLSDG